MIGLVAFFGLLLGLIVLGGGWVFCFGGFDGFVASWLGTFGVLLGLRC